MPTKDEYTIAFKENDPDSNDIDFQDAYVVWWQNQRRDGGFRLTQQGCMHCIDKLELEYFEIKFEDIPNTPGFLLDLDKYIKTPYYIKIVRNIIKSIVLFDKKTHFTLTMYNNDFKKFINAHKI
jgi:hypothetical protein